MFEFAVRAHCTRKVRLLANVTLDNRLKNELNDLKMRISHLLFFAYTVKKRQPLEKTENFFAQMKGSDDCDAAASSIWTPCSQNRYQINCRRERNLKNIEKTEFMRNQGF